MFYIKKFIHLERKGRWLWGKISDEKLGEFRSQLKPSRVSSYTEEL